MFTDLPDLALLAGAVAVGGMKNFCEHYHGERNHQGKANQLKMSDLVR